MIFSDEFAKWLQVEYQDHSVQELILAFLRRRSYQRAFALSLLELGRRSTASWSLRRLAALLLQHQLGRLVPSNEREHDVWFESLGIKPAGEVAEMLPDAVLAQGYTRRDRPGFITEFQQRLARPAALFRRIRGARTSEANLREFLAYARQDCRLVLARYLFSPAEVVARIKQAVRISSGLRRTYAHDVELVEGAAKRARDNLPAYEAAILKGLEAGDRVYWVADDTSSEINSLVEYPLGTVVLVIKPPGSDLEIELKRAGRRGPRPLNVVFRRNGNHVPPAHRLDAGARLWSLQWEAHASARLARIYLLAQGCEPPLSTVTACSVIHTILKPMGEVNLLNYFGEPDIFGPGFQEMRAALVEATAASEEESGIGFPGLVGECGETMRFIRQMAPGFGILAGTSSFRLDRLAGYLAGDGAEKYFQTGLGRSYSLIEAKGLADTLLSEVLGVFEPPARFSTYDRYVSNAFAYPENRARADAVYLSIVEEIARLWGTLLAVRGYSNGESFVSRNVGLKSVWREGRWQVRPVFMDHDDLQLPGKDLNHSSPRAVWYGSVRDRLHILGSPQPGPGPRGEIPMLQSIYRVGPDVAQAGSKRFYAVIALSYRRTQEAMRTQPALRALFSEQFLEYMGDWDHAVAEFLRGDPAWETAVRGFLAGRGHSPTRVRDFLETIRVHTEVLRELALLYMDSPGG